MNGFDWDDFRVLLAVAERRSFSAGAKSLGISQPTAGRRVERLEQTIGARLLVRRSRGVVPTPAGLDVLAEARRMADGASAAARRATGHATPEATPVRISATEGLGALWLTHRVGAALRELPGLRVEIVVDNAPADLAARAADVAIRLFRPKQPDLVARNVGMLRFGFYATKAYLAARGVPRRLGDLARHDHVGFVEQGTTAPSYVRWLRRLVPPERFVVSASGLVAMYEAGRAGHGIVLGTTAILDGDAALVRVLPRAEPPTMPIWLATHVDVRRNQAVSTVVESLARAFATERASFGA